MTTIPFGAWPSPISAADVAGARSIDDGKYVGDEIWWAERRPEQGGRVSIRRLTASGGIDDVLPAPWNARTRVHEYGGSAWSVTPSGELLFSNHSDQRLYRLEPGGQPRALTPEPAEPSGDRYAEPTVLPDTGNGEDVLCIRERYLNGSISRELVVIPLDGSGADDASKIRSVVGGSDFLAMPTVSPNGQWLAWIAWNHPQMPWDGTELRVASLGSDRTAGAWRTLIGSTTESILQPTWLDDDRLLATSDRSDWWNLLIVDRAGAAAPIEIAPMAAEIGGPLWVLNSRWWTVLPDGRVCFVASDGTDSLWLLDIPTGATSKLDTQFTWIEIGEATDGRVLFIGQVPGLAAGLREIDLSTGAVHDIRLGSDNLPPADVLPPGQLETFTGRRGRDVHAILYPPTAPFAAAEGELPPYIVRVHGGPTGQSKPKLDLEYAFWTSRGIGIVDVNYGGSTGFGRAYREQLREQWGIVDVEDVVAVAEGMAARGIADGDRIAILGGSAGGWTVLSAMTLTDTFGCGVSYFGVAELIKFAEDTHDFESRYLDGLIGPLPDELQRYIDRAPLSNVAGLSAPVLLLQGLDDPIVPPSQAEMFRDALLSKGIPHAYLAFEGESHGFRRAETVIACLESSLSFLGQVFGFDPPGVDKLVLVTS